MNNKVIILASTLALISTISLSGCGVALTAPTPTPMPLYMETVLSHADELGTKFSMGVGEELMTDSVLQDLDETMIQPAEDAIRKDPGNMQARLMVAYFHYLAGNINQAWNELYEIIAMDPKLAEPYLVLGDMVYKLAMLNMILQNEYEVSEACGIIFTPGEESRLLFRQALEYYHTGATLNTGLTRTDGIAKFTFYSQDSLDRKQKQASKYLAGTSMDIVYYEDVAQAGLWMTEFESSGYETVLNWSISSSYDDSPFPVYAMPCLPDPETPQEYLERGIAYYEYGLNQRALSDFNQAIEQKGDFAEAYYRRAGVYYKAGEYEKAVMDFNEALELEPGNAEIWAGRGEAYRMMGEIQLAVQDLDQAIALDPELSYAYAVRGSVYLDQSQPDLARSDFNKSLEIDPDNVSAREMSGRLYLEMRQFDQAVAEFSKLLENNPNNIRYLISRGSAYSYMEKFELALADYDQAVKLDPNDSVLGKLYLVRGMMNFMLGNTEQSATDFQKHLELHPDSGDEETIKNFISP